MISVRRSKDRGHFNHGWLDSFHSFSFAQYHDPAHHHFRALRVINEDRVAPAMGFGTHPHADMEILTYVLSGTLAHKDSLGNGSTISPGEIQRMSAGTGIQHSEFNASQTETVHLLQIWIVPASKGRPPSYEQKPIAWKAGDWTLLASPSDQGGLVKIGQDALLWAVKLDAGKTLPLPLKDDRYEWLQVARGSVTVDSQRLDAGDGAGLEKASGLTLRAESDCEVLFFDLA